MTENVVTSIKQTRKLIIGICEIFETVFPQAHIFETAERLLITLNPVW
jgi:hypothetical protein